ncbi:MAG: 2-5 ligase superfamily [Thermoleophilia bacterium]|nr:2-5 ligase superfamily [Thermoleophilia bacterium]
MSLLRDPRHRYSYELRPDRVLDARLRAIALELESAGMIESGSATATRFQPHLTFLRTGTPVPDALDVAAVVLHGSGGDRVTLGEPATFASGRIVHVSPEDPSPIEAAREAMLTALDAADVDPVVAERAWVPHVSLSYSTLPGRTEEVLAHVRRVMPLDGGWGSLECWDLGVRPTVRLHRVELPISG